jgi:hypothetical protein
MKIKFIFAWYDFWVGLFYDKNKRYLYIFPIPMFGIVVKFKEKGPRSKRKGVQSKELEAF